MAPFFPKIKMEVKFHYYTYPQKNDHELFTLFVFVDHIFSKRGNVICLGFPMANWFSCGRFSVARGGGFGRGKLHPN